MISLETDPTHMKGLKQHLWVTYVDAFASDLRNFLANDTNPVAFMMSLSSRAWLHFEIELLECQLQHNIQSQTHIEIGQSPGKK